jgi:hypothetical protein
MHTGGAAPYRGRSSHLGGLAFLRALHSPAHPPARLDTARVVAMSGQMLVCGVVSCVACCGVGRRGRLSRRSRVVMAARKLNPLYLPWILGPEIPAVP